MTKIKERLHSFTFEVCFVYNSHMNPSHYELYLDDIKLIISDDSQIGKKIYRDLKKLIKLSFFSNEVYFRKERIKQKLAGMSPVQYRIHTSQIAV